MPILGRSIETGRLLDLINDLTVRIRSLEDGRDQTVDVKHIVVGDASVTLKKDGTIVIRGKDITIEASGKIDIKAAGEVVLKGSKITQN